jgi:hypothetical protein
MGLGAGSFREELAFGFQPDRLVAIFRMSVLLPEMVSLFGNGRMIGNARDGSMGMDGTMVVMVFHGGFGGSERGRTGG